MLTLSHVFTDGALFQADSELTVRGRALPLSAVTLALTRDVDHAQIRSIEAKADENGGFTFLLQTPVPSFDEHTITITAENETQVIRRVLFGELWFASGQSNMEMLNLWLTDNEWILDEVATKTIRVFGVESPASDWNSYKYPWEPDPATPGGWIFSHEREKLNNSSALALTVASRLYDALHCPVGVLDLSFGSTCVFCWLPRDAVLESQRLLEFLPGYNEYFTEDIWNTAMYNLGQVSAQYNYKVGPVEGLKFRGILWYQGENDCRMEFAEKIYGDTLRIYHEAYAKRFAADPERFMMILSLLFPFSYTDEGGDCILGEFNDAIVKTALAEPHKFAFATIGDFEPSWAYHMGNNTVHPTNKYDVGERMARLVLANVYDSGGQKSPAAVDSYEIRGDRLILKLNTDRYPIRVGNGHKRAKAHCLYVAGEDDIYLPAEYEILGNDTLAVWCDEIKEPKNACYCYPSYDVKCNVFVGEYPLAPFATDTSKQLHIEAHRWYDAAEDVVWADGERAFFHPMWKPVGETEVCRDTAFCRDSVASVRVCGDFGSEGVMTWYGTYLTSYPYNRLDLDKFAAIEANFYNGADVSLFLRITSANGDVTVPFTKCGEEKFGWTQMRASLDMLPEGEILKMAFCARDDRAKKHFFNIEKVRLIKK